MIRTAEALAEHPIAGIDINLGCPAPKIYKKNVGGGLLRDPDRIGSILAAMRAAVPGLLTVKMRIGFEDTLNLDRIIDIINLHRIDLLTVHGRTVREMYRSEVHYDQIARVVARAQCPVLANGNVTSAARARQVTAETGSAGIMIGRHAIRNPWIFRHCRETFSGREASRVTLADVREYVDRLYRETRDPGFPERAHVNKMKKYLNFVGQGVDAEGAFLHDMRRAETEVALFEICDRHLLGNPSALFSSEPYPGVIARPNCETPSADADGCSLESVTA
jgi:tRNA-dihydrouridine synthase